MPLTDETGAPIPEDDPRVPTAEQTAEVAADCDRKEAVLAANGVQVSPLVLIEGKVAALVSLMVPPEGPVRRLFEHRVQARRHEILVETMEAVQEAQRGPALQVAQSVPQDLRLEIHPR